MLSIESRGRDASGIAWFNEDVKRTQFMKAPLRASDFYVEIFETVPTTTKHAIIHTRAATQGSKHDNNNNHPIALPGIVGIHNGMLSNDRQIARDLKLDLVGEVDSEVIFHIIKAHGGIDKVGDLLRGDAAVAWMEQTNPGLRPDIQIAHLGGRSVSWGMIKADEDRDFMDGVVFASTLAALKDATKESELFLYEPKESGLKAGDYMALAGGSIRRRRSDIAQIDNYRRSTGYSGYNGGSNVGSTSITTNDYSPNGKRIIKRWVGSGPAQLGYWDGGHFVEVGDDNKPIIEVTGSNVLPFGPKGAAGDAAAQTESEDDRKYGSWLERVSDRDHRMTEEAEAILDELLDTPDYDDISQEDLEDIIFQRRGDVTPGWLREIGSPLTDGLADLLTYPAFRETDPLDWELDKTNSFGDQLWWNTDIFTFAIRRPSGAISAVQGAWDEWMNLRPELEETVKTNIGQIALKALQSAGIC